MKVFLTNFLTICVPAFLLFLGEFCLFMVCDRLLSFVDVLLCATGGAVDAGLMGAVLWEVVAKRILEIDKNVTMLSMFLECWFDGNKTNERS